MKKNKTLRIIVDVVIIVVGIVFLGFGIKDTYDYYQDSKTKDNVKFYKDYRLVGEDNIYKYVDLKNAKKLIEEESGVLLIGEPNDPWMQILVKPLEDIVSNDLENIYYLETKDLNSDKEDYKSFSIDLAHTTIPCIVAFKTGDVVLKLDKSDIFDSEFEGAPIEYFNENTTEELETKLSIISDLK